MGGGGEGAQGHKAQLRGHALRQGLQMFPGERLSHCSLTALPSRVPPAGIKDSAVSSVNGQKVHNLAQVRMQAGCWNLALNTATRVV